MEVLEGLLMDEKLGKQSVGERRGPQQQPETVSKPIPSAFPAHAIPLRRAPLPPAGSLGVLLNRISDNELTFLDLVSSPPPPPFFHVYRGGASVSSGDSAAFALMASAAFGPGRFALESQAGRKRNMNFRSHISEQLCRYLFIKHNK